MSKHYTLNEHDQITVPNLSAFWLPELTVREVIHGTTYIVTGSYEGHEPFTRKLERIMTKEFTSDPDEFTENDTYGTANDAEPEE
jgi:hypothetical protein